MCVCSESNTWNIFCLTRKDNVLVSELIDGEPSMSKGRGGFRGGGGGGGGGSRGSGPPLSYMKNDVMHTVIYAAFCMLPSLDLQDCTSF